MADRGQIRGTTPLWTSTPSCGARTWPGRCVRMRWKFSSGHKQIGSRPRLTILAPLGEAQDGTARDAVPALHPDRTWSLFTNQGHHPTSPNPTSHLAARRGYLESSDRALPPTALRRPCESRLARAPSGEPPVSLLRLVILKRLTIAIPPSSDRGPCPDRRSRGSSGRIQLASRSCSIAM